MKKMLCFIKWSIFNSVLFLLIIGSNVYGAAETPEISIVTDKTPGVSVNNGQII